MGAKVGNPFISTALVGQHNRTLQQQAASSRQSTAQVAEHLAAVRVFAGCGRKELRAIAKLAKVSMVHQGTQIITEGDEGNTMYVILTGTARVSRGGRKLATMGPGVVFGELAMLSPGPRTATVVALSDMELAIISRRNLTSALEAAPAFARKLLEELADMVRELDKRVV